MTRSLVIKQRLLFYKRQVFMILYINTSKNNFVEIALKQGSKFVARKSFKSNRTQAERLLPEIDKLIKSHKTKLNNLRAIEAANTGGSFTSLRIGVVTANALGYALGIPVKSSAKLGASGGKFSVLKPIYDREPEITKKKPNNRQLCG
jgi:tRNA A37 threonylcarbamoyladenosine modification protein TsaB